MQKSSRIFLLTGLTCLVAAILTAWLLSSSTAELIPAVLAEAALIFLAALIIERSLLTEFNHDAELRADQLTSRVKDSITNFFRDEFDVLKYAGDYSVRLVPPRRSTTKYPNVTYSKIAEAISRSKSIKLFCTSGIDIFPPPNTIQTPIVEKIRQKVQQGESFTIKVLSCDPDGDYAHIRGLLENTVNPTYIKMDIRQSQLSLLQITQGATPQFNLKWYTYKFTPQAWFILTDTEGFIELYHFGLSQRAPSDPNSCIGGRVPLLHVTAGSALWQALNEYFEFLISLNKDSRIEPKCIEYFGVESVPMQQ